MSKSVIEQLIRDHFTDYQKAWILDESPMKLAEKSRRIGWTYATSFRRVMRAMTIPGLDCWVSTRDLTTAKEFVRDCAVWLRLANVVSGVAFDKECIDEERDIHAQVIELPNRSRIYVLTSNPDALAGKGGDIVLDEFALHKNQHLLWQVALPTASVWGYQVEVISTHRGVGTLFNKFCKDAKRGNKMGWSFHSVNIVQACDGGLIARINKAVAERGGAPTTAVKFIKTQRRRCATEGQWNQEYMCQPQDDLGSLLTYAMIEACALPWDKLRTTAGDKRGDRFLSMDVARKQHKSVIWLLERSGGILWTRRQVTMRNVKLRHQTKTYCDMYRHWGCMAGAIDATGIGQQLAEDCADELGSSVEQVTFTHNAQNEMANDMVHTFEDLGVRVPDDRDTEEGLHKVEKAVTSHGNISFVAPDDEDGHADEFWSLALGVRAANSGSGPARGATVTELTSDTATTSVVDGSGSKAITREERDTQNAAEDAGAREDQFACLVGAGSTEGY